MTPSNAPDRPPVHLPPSSGPWSIGVEADHYQIRDAAGIAIALIVPLPSSPPRAEELANAHLFKSGPRMFAALATALDVFGSELIDPSRYEPDERELARLDAVLLMRYALADAQGGDA